MSNLKITAELSGPIVWPPPHLDGICASYCARTRKVPIVNRRCDPIQGYAPSPILHRTIGGVGVPCCSSPIAVAQNDRQERFAKRLAVEHADLLAEDARLVVATGGAVFKSYRLPLRLALCEKIVWFAVGNGRTLRKILRGVHSLGVKRSIGMGRVKGWTVEHVEQDYSWFADSVLMRPLPKCAELPADLRGYADSFGAIRSPYWHPGHFQEIVVPV